MKHCDGQISCLGDTVSLGGKWGTVVDATDDQASIVTNFILEDARILGGDGLARLISRSGPAIEIYVHEDVSEVLPARMNEGIPTSPTRRVPGRRGALLLHGANQLRAELASLIASVLDREESLVALVPHAYALPAEIESLQEDYGHCLRVRDTRVYVHVCGPDQDPETLRRGLASMISCYSVAWIMRNQGVEEIPVAALVPVFDGDGWGVASFGEDRASLRSVAHCVRSYSHGP